MEIMNIIKIPRTLRNINRFREILRVVVRHGFGDIVARMGLEGVLEQAARVTRLGRAEGPAAARTRYSTEERIRMVFEELGPTFIKLGQILATRPDLVPMSLVLELRKLQDRVPSFPFEEVRATVERELDRPLDEAYASFDEVPIAAASIGQVHRASLPGGEAVVVKVRRPQIEQVIATDLDILLFVAEVVVENLAEAKQYDPVGTVEEFGRSIRREIDYGREAGNMERFARIFADDPDVVTPRVHRSHSTVSVLTMEYIDGFKATDAEAVSRAGIDRMKVAEVGTRCVLRQVFEHGFFHADPHPGNFFVLPGDKVCLLDYGQMGTLDQERIDDLLTYLVSILFNDTAQMVRLFQRMGLVDEFADTRPLRQEVDDLIRRYYAVEIGRIDIGKFIGEVFEIIARHKVVIPSDLFLMSKALATIEGTVHELYPDFDPVGTLRPYLLEIYIRRLSDPRFLTRPLRRAAEEYGLLAAQFPRDARMVLARLRRGELGLEVRVPELGRAVLESNRSANRLAFSVIIGAIVIGSSLLIGVDRGPAVYGVSLPMAVGAGGYALALGLGLLVSFGMFRSGKL
ncbi:MAG: AarF/ABC1/UbiB kinase family protein [Planctomycetes bacterium]|nr:AarF/ABC1/UbiB kinase family protein [Planctomycetota bacterium]